MVIDADLSEIIILPETELIEIIQNVKTILSTVKGTVPLDRDFGVDSKILDLPISVVRAKISAAVTQAVSKFEPRVRVKKILYQQSDRETMSGNLIPAVDVELVESNLRGYVRLD